MNTQIRSNVIKGEILSQTRRKTIEEIFDTLIGVFGPAANNALVNPNQGLNAGYHTRDGKVVLDNIMFDNQLAVNFRQIMSQAIDIQSKYAGDGTTTATIFYSILVKVFEEFQPEVPTIVKRRILENLIELITREITFFTKDIEDNMQVIKQIVYTATKDAKLAEIVYEAFRKSNSETLLDVKIDPFGSEITIKESESARIEGEFVFQSKPLEMVNGLATIPDAVILYVDGGFELSAEALAQLTANQYGFAKNLILLCNEIHPSGKTPLSHYKEVLSNTGHSARTELYIYRISNYRNWKPEHKSDLCTIVYDTDGMTGVANLIHFPMNLASVIYSEEVFKELYGNFEVAIENSNAINYALQTMSNVTYTRTGGLAIDRPMNTNTQELIKELNDTINTTKDSRLEESCRDRIRKILGNYVVITIGADMVRDQQRESELILDAVISAQRASEHGYVTTNGMLALFGAAYRVANAIETTDATEELTKEMALAIAFSASKTFQMLIDSRVNPSNLVYSGIKFDKDDTTLDALSKRLYADFHYDINSIQSLYADTNAPEILFSMFDQMIEGHSESVVIADTTVSVRPIEPADTILTITKYMTTPFDIAALETYVGAHFLNNYL